MKPKDQTWVLDTIDIYVEGIMQKMRDQSNYSVSIYLELQDLKKQVEKNKETIKSLLVRQTAPKTSKKTEGETSGSSYYEKITNVLRQYGPLQVSNIALKVGAPFSNSITSTIARLKRDGVIIRINRGVYDIKRLDINEN